MYMCVEDGIRTCMYGCEKDRRHLLRPNIAKHQEFSFMYVRMYIYWNEGHYMVGFVVSGSSGRLPSLLPRTLNLASLSAEWSRRISTARRCPLQAATYRAVAPYYQRHSHTYIHTISMLLRGRQQSQRKKKRYPH
jgi:hypothetical protein